VSGPPCSDHRHKSDEGHHPAQHAVQNIKTFIETHTAPLSTPMVDGDTDDRYQKASSAYSVSLMSNTKWRKLFSALTRAGVKLERATWRFIDSSHEHVQGQRLIGVGRLPESVLSPGQSLPVRTLRALCGSGPLELLRDFTHALAAETSVAGVLARRLLPCFSFHPSRAIMET
jgi:hypothetical protein